MRSCAVSRRKRHKALFGAVLFCASFGARIALADEPEVERSAAQALFERARQLMHEGDYVEACRKLGQSLKLERATGTLMNLGLCNEKLGRTASAWVDYNEALSLAVKNADAEREATARQRLREVEPHLRRISVEPPAGHQAGAWLVIDDIQLGGEAFGTALPLDTGPHHVRAGAPKFSEVELNFALSEASPPVTHLSLPRLAPVLEPLTAASPRPTRATPPDTGSDRLRLVLLGSSLGVGVAGLATSGYFGWRAANSWQDRNRRCTAGCDEGAVAAGQSAKSFAQASDVALGAGLVGLALGGYLFFSTPHHRALTVTAGPGSGALLLRASF